MIVDKVYTKENLKTVIVNPVLLNPHEMYCLTCRVCSRTFKQVKRYQWWCDIECQQWDYDGEGVEKYCGVYMLWLDDDQRIYVGESVDLHSRLNAHFNELNGSNKHMRNRWKELGQPQIRASVLYLCKSKKEALMVESTILYLLDDDAVYN